MSSRRQSLFLVVFSSAVVVLSREHWGRYLYDPFAIATIIGILGGSLCVILGFKWRLWIATLLYLVSFTGFAVLSLRETRGWVRLVGGLLALIGVMAMYLNILVQAFHESRHSGASGNKLGGKSDCDRVE